jgi:hypothetical protein
MVAITSRTPHELTDYIKGREGYDYAHHGKAGNPSTDFVPDGIVDRFCLVGPTSADATRRTELAELGADQFALYLMHDQRSRPWPRTGRTSSRN